MKKVFVLVVLFISITLIGCDIFSEHEVDKHIKYDEEYHWLETSLGDKTEIEHHIFTEEVVKEATCSQKGEKKISCDCGYIEKVEIETKEHKYDETITNPTCDKEGFITYTCEVCGDTYVENYEDELGHSFGEWMVETKPTEDAAGLMIRICSIDESHIDTLNLPKLNSEDYILDTKEPTCKEDGFKKYIYQIDDVIIGDFIIVIPKLEHDLETHEGKEATCEEDGWKEYQTCSNCDFTTYSEIKALGHSYGEWKSNNNGTHTHVCNNDNSHKDTKDCTYGEWITVTAAGPFNEGLEKHVCSGCGYTETRVTAATHEHAYSNEFTVDKKATCTEDGLKSKHCTKDNCTSVIEETVIKALGHSYGEVEYIWSDNFKELTAKCVCENDGEHIQLETVETTYEIKLAATCTEEGLGVYTSNEFTNQAFTSQTKDIILSELGHDLINHEAKQPTCTEIGWNEYDTCSRCDYTTYSEIKALGHSYGEWIIDLEPTTDNIGYKSKHCTRENCNEKTNVTEIPMKPYSDGLLYVLNTTKTGYIVSGIGECTDKDINITPIYNGKPVVSIGSNAFYYCWHLTSATIPESVTSIGSSAFEYCSSLTSITLPFVGETLNGTENTHFGYIFGASSYSSNSSYVPISLKEVIITGGTSIGYSAFKYCRSLTSITILESVTSIGESAFRGCDSLTSITIPESVTSIGESAFYGCSNLTNVTFEEGSQLTSIGNYAFYRCYDLTSLTIPESATSIGESAFTSCGLTSITIPESVTSIGDSAFCGCSSLTNVTFEKGSQLTSIGEFAFYECSSLTSITIPFVGEKADGNGETHFGYIFGAESYYYNRSRVPTSLKEVIITGGESIGRFAFYECSSLTSITIPESVTSIGGNAFYNCNNLENIKMNNLENLIYMGYNAIPEELINMYINDGYF